MHQSIPRALIVVSLLCTVGWSSPARAQAWFDTSWVFRSPITVTNSNGSTLTNFQVGVTLDSTFNFAGAKTDGSDLRVTAVNGTTPLSFWIEKWNATTHQAKVWVKIPSLPAGNTTIFLYYGMPTATSTANGKNTFELFDDFTATASPGYYHLGPASTIMTQDTPWEHEAPHTLSVVPAPSGAPYAYYGYYGLQGCSGIGIAGTNDLLNWTKFPTNPLFTGGGERWPHVLKNGSTYFMVHTINFCGTPSIVYRTSTSGTTWSGTTQMVAPQAGNRNQNPNLFQDPKTGLFHLYWYRGNDATLWTIMGRTASTLSGLASAPDQVLISSNKTLAAPNMMYRDSTYFLSTEISETVWKTVIFSAPTPTGPFTKLPGNPLMGDGAACLFQLSIGSSIYQYYCKETAAVWTLDMRVSDTTLGRQQIGKIDSTQWAPDGGDWHSMITSQPNGAQGMVAQGSTNAEQILKSSYSATNYVLESSGRLLEGRTWGIGARGANADDGYRLNLYDDLDGGQNLFLYRWDNGDATELWSKAVGTIDKNTWYKLGLRVSGSQISVYFNDVLQTPTPINDPNLDLGPVQLAGEESSLAQFDDVHVRKHAANEPASVRGPEEILGNSRPVALIGAPASSSFYFGSSSIALTSSSMDAQTPPESLLYKWDVERHHAADPPTITTFTTRNASFVPNHGADSAVVYYHIRLKVTDLGGLSDSTAINIYPEIDLAPSAIGVAPAAPNTLDSLTLSVVLHNNGRVHTPLTHWYLRDGNTVLAQGDAAIAALDSTTIVRKVGPRTLGVHTLRFTADSLLAVVETSETNNASVRSINITNPPGVNQPPVANASAAPSTGAAPLSVNFSSAGSSDPDPDSLSFAWNFGNGASSTQANPTYVYTGSGVFAAVLTVNDGHGGVATDTVIVTVGVASGFPTTAVLDNFNRANGPIGGSWIDPVHNLVGLMIDNNALVQLCCSYASPVWNGAVFGADQEAYITLTAVTANAPEHDLMLKLQGNSDATAHIEVRFDKPLGQVAVGTYDPAVGWASPAPPIPVDFAAGDQLGARAKSDGIVEVYKNGLLIGTVDCSAWAYATLGGRIGMTIDQAYSSRLDNFGGGNVVAYVPPSITSASPLPSGQTGSAYSQTLTGTGGTTPYAWAVTVGTLPAGLTLNPSSGAITGTPTGHGTSNFTIRLTDAASVAVTKAFALTVNPAPLVITSTSPRPSAQVGVAYTDTVKATGGVTPYAWAITLGALPAGLTLNASSGVITGTPTAYGTSNFTIRVTDSLSVQTTKALAMTVNPAALVITSTTPRPNAQVGVAYTDTIKATGGATPYAWAVTVGALPAGLTLNAASGTITGTPTAYGTSNFTIRVTDSLSVQTTKAFALTVNPAALVITSTTPRPNAQVGVAYTDTIKATGGATPYAWAVTVGALPAGLTLNASSGTITGTPTAYGTSNFTIRVTDSLSVQTTKAFALTVNPAALVITTASPLASGQVGVAYSQSLAGTGGATPYSWAVTVGALPAGLTLNASSGAITGTPTAYGTSNFTIRLTDSLSVQTTKAFALTVNPAALVITTASPLASGQVGVAYSQTLAGTGGATPYSWAVSIGSLPAGLTLNASSGAITGTPTAYGTSNFTIRLTDSLSVQTTKAFALTVNPAALVITTASPLASGQVGVAYSQTIAGTGGATPYSWLVSVGSLPAGLTLNASSGAITGTPTAYGTSNFTIRLTDSLSVQTTKAFALTVAPAALVITTASPLASGQVGVAYSLALAGTGGATPYAWTVTVGALPAGLTLNAASGAITGTPTAYGTSNFTIRLTDSLSVQTTKAFALTVNPAALVITTASPLASGQVGVAYSQTVTGTGGATPYSWVVSIGSLPAGLTLNAASGAITGTPTAYGTSNFTIRLTDSLSVQTTKAFALTVAPAALVITTASPLASGQVGVAYSQSLAGTGGATPYSWAVTVGTLPAGLTLNASSGAITGTPTAYGTSNFTIQLTDSVSVQTTKAFALTVNPAALVITTASPLASGQVGVAYSQTVAGTGGATPYNWAVSVGTLPAGLTLNASSGAIIGTPTAYGTSNFTIQLTDSLSVQTTKTFALTVAPAALVITTASPLASGQVGVAYSQTIAGTGGATPYSWAVSVGTLPAGLTLNASSGAITGTPTAYGTSNFTIRLTDSLSVQTTKAFALTVAPAALVITTASPLASGQVGVAYSQTIAGTGGATPYSWAVSVGTLPAGLTLNASSGAITGTPTAYGTSNFTIRLTDSLSVQTTKAFALTVAPAALVITTASPLASGQVGVAYSQSLAGTGGATPYSWAVTVGSLPAGLTLNASSGAITGTPTAYGTSNFTIQLTDSVSVQTTKAFALTVNPAALVITTASPLASGQVGVAYSQTVAGTGGATPYNWAVSVGTLPAGLTLNASSGAIIGTPTAYGTSNFTIQLTDSLSVQTTKTFALTVAPAPLVITTASPLASGQVGIAYSQTLAGTGGATPYSWAVSVGTLPAGLTLNASSGAITGTPTAYGTSNFTIQLTDSLSVQTTKAFDLTVNPATLLITTASPLASGQVGVAYSQSLAGTGGATPYAWAVSVGTLPAGLTLNASSGAITGTPTTYGTTNFTIQLTDSASVVTTKEFALTVSPATLAITSTTPLPTAYLGTFYARTLTVTGGATPYVWAVSTGALPAGLSLNPSTGEISGTPTTLGTTLFTIRVTDAASTTDTLAASLQVDPNTLGPVGWWRMEDGSGSTIQDVSGWGNHGTVVADATWTTGLFGLGLQLDGAQDRTLVPDAPSLDLSTGLTLATWIRPGQVADQCLMSKALESATDGYELGLSGSGKPFVRFNQATSGELFRLNSTQTYPSTGTTWMHLAAIFDGSEIRLYVNGVLDSTKAAGLTVAVNGLPLAFGAQGDGARPYLGTLDEVKVFGRALSAGEVSTLAVLPPVAVDPTPIPSLTQLSRAMPNPFRNTTTLEYALSVGGRVELSIFDLSGRRVRSLTRGESPAGVHRVQWDGRDEVGNRLEAGVYFARLETPQGGFNKRIIRLN